MAQLSDTDRARQASALLDNALFAEAMAVLREGYIMQLMACAPADTAATMAYARALRSIAIIRKHLEFVLRKGEITQATLAEMADIERRESVFKRAVRGFFSDDANAEKVS